MLAFSLFLACVLVTAVYSACPNKCSGHGTCGANDVCTCTQFYTYGDCSGRLCPQGRSWLDTPSSASIAHEMAECSDRGTCDRTTGECVCDTGYTGSACRRTTCPDDCNGHGTCQFIEEFTTSYSYAEWEQEKLRGCVCDGGYEGHACQNRICPKGDDPLTIGSTYDMKQYIKISDSSDLATSGDYALTYTDPYGASFTTGPIALNAAQATNCENIQTALRALPTPLLTTVTVAAQTAYPITRTTSAYAAETITVGTPIAYVADTIHVCVVTFRSVAGSTGLQELLVPITDEQGTGYQPVLDGLSSTHAIVVGEHTDVATSGDIENILTELAECSNRGLCDSSTGKCTCFLGHKGTACESQEALV